MNQLADTLDRETPHRRRKGGRHKPFKLERRYVGNAGMWFMERFRVWHLFGAYETERARENAIRAIQNPRHGFIQWEYRNAEAAK